MHVGGPPYARRRRAGSGRGRRLLRRRPAAAPRRPAGARSRPARASCRLRDLCIETDGEPWTLAWSGDRVARGAGRGVRRACASPPSSCGDIVDDQSTPIALMSNRLLDMPEGRLADFLELVARAARRARRPPHPRARRRDASIASVAAHASRPTTPTTRCARSSRTPATSTSRASSARPRWRRSRPTTRWPRRTTRRAIRAPGSPRRTTASSTSCAWRASTATRRRRVALLDDERFQRIGRIPGAGHVRGASPARASARSSKPIGVVKGISDVPWHKDCSLGRHSYECCSLTVGISVTGADAESGPAPRRAGLAPRARLAGALRAARPRPPAARPADADRRRDRAPELHAAHEPAAGRAHAQGPLHRVRSAAPSIRRRPRPTAAGCRRCAARPTRASRRSPATSGSDG